ncbi:MFS transporter [Streptomyces nitrosporeus]|uniref:MFS transporter n=1 Tax=Streptomyces nitrosporeus TaxID=28894 RepID=A0A5J6F3K2_9ACTN|nr:MFS transporter [Streptomyces nitrosporeus]QEU70899.1 MFS transporter [Streptomyces nitrosporeus]
MPRRHRPARRRTVKPAAAAHPFRALRVRNFRLFAGGQVVSVAGTWMSVVAQDWLVLEMTGDSATELGTVTALQFTPVLLFTLHGGRLADRYDKRTLLTLANLVSGLLALLLAVLVLGDLARLTHIYLFALGLGLVNSVEVPTRMAFVGELVGPELLPNASALSAAYFNVARVAGPAAAGLVIAALGSGWVLLVNAVSYAATVLTLRCIRPGELHRDERRTGPARVTDGLRHVRDRPGLTVPLALVAGVGLFGLNFQLTLPLLAKTVYRADAASFGLLTTVFAAGSLAAAFLTTARTSRPSARLVTCSALVFAVLEAAVGRAPGYPAAVVLLFLTGGASVYFAQAANHRVQLGCDPRFRGRVLALYTLILQGTTPLGALLVGRVGAEWGARACFLAGGLASLATALAVLALPSGRSGPEPAEHGNRAGRALPGTGRPAEDAGP